MNSLLAVLLFISLSYVYGTTVDKEDCGSMCMMYCRYGNVIDERGCPLCKCNPAPPNDQCEKPICDTVCFLGYVDGEDGCPTCECINPQ
ncbi:BPTI/Kunitz domain-containing protein 4-like [Mizuhopecten yessoensis]|uniref:BPTI/Kunitz domain-containing protein 4-like n=1 Tax=Mizuhopecten yessoensis TaxID=6573 RepID=UPI000B45DF9A|nr:BPTI/Kunitz domain-containing protein 4-like [Mizuhopecten yessoensis]